MNECFKVCDTESHTLLFRYVDGGVDRFAEGDTINGWEIGEHAYFGNKLRCGYMELIGDGDAFTEGQIFTPNGRDPAKIEVIAGYGVGDRAAFFGVYEFPKKLSYYKVEIEKKTSLLIAFSTLSGGILGNASTKDLKNLIDIGLLIGRIFQTQDDILDLEGTEKEMGKKVNKDQKLNKATIIRLKDISYAKKEVQDLCIDAKKKLALIKKDTLNLSYLIYFLSYRTN